jgi:hypothetical protein
MKPNEFRKRRDVLELASYGGIVFASGVVRGVAGCKSSETPRGATEAR